MLLIPLARSFTSHPSLLRSPTRLLSTKAITSPLDNLFDDYTAERTFMFPGQGAQTVGMAKETAATCPAAADLFERASDILGYDLLERCAEGPKEVLDTTAVSQPAIFVSSMAAVEKFKMEGGDVDSATVACGLSLGEYSALCFAGAMSFEDGVRVTKARGEAMQAASDAVESGMVSVIGLDKEATAKLCEKASLDAGEEITIANFLCSGNYAVSGSLKACGVVKDIAKPEFKVSTHMREQRGRRCEQRGAILTER